jgi:hypothetical protein
MDLDVHGDVGVHDFTMHIHLNPIYDYITPSLLRDGPGPSCYCIGLCGVTGSARHTYSGKPA